MNNAPKNIGRFVALIFIQVAILNNIQLGGFINPYMYVLFILLLPFETPNWMLLLVSFLLGLSIDVFSNTLGMHASACVFMGYMRPYALNYLSTRDEYELGTKPRISDYGFIWFFKYCAILVFVHHTFLFFIEVFSFSNFGETIIRIVFSTFFSLMFIVIFQFLLFEKQQK